MIILKIYQVGNRIVNTYMYSTKDGYVMIDTGYDNYMSKVIKRMEKNNISPEKIKYIFLTHAHDDHAGFLNEFLTKYPEVKVVCSNKSKETLKKGQNPFEGGCSSKLALMFCNLMKLFGKGEHRFPPIEEKFFDRFIEVSDENRADVEKLLEGKILDTQGHTSDSISLMINNGVLFCGDAAMNGFPSLNRVTIWVENKEDFIESWKKIIKIAPAKVYPSHGKPFDCVELERKMPKLKKIKLYKLY